MRVLYCTGGGVGNVVMSTPAIAALAEMGYEVDVMLALDAPPGADGLLRGWTAIHHVAFFARESNFCYDRIVHSVWHRSHFGATRCPELAAPTAPEFLREHDEVEANMVPVRELGFTGPTPAPHVEYDPPAYHGGSWYYVIGTGCKADAFWRRKKWQGWRELQSLLGAERCVYLGTREESRHWMACDLCGATTLARAAGWIAGARAYVGIDNGLAHVAAALGVPTVVMFGATSEVKNAPRGPGPVRILTKSMDCRPCQMTVEWDRCRSWRCMDFEAAEVAEAVNGLLHHGDTEARRTARAG